MITILCVVFLLLVLAFSPIIDELDRRDKADVKPFPSRRGEVLAARDMAG